MVRSLFFLKKKKKISYLIKGSFSLRSLIQCDAIRLEHFLWRCRLGHFNKTYQDEDNILDRICESKYVRNIINLISILYILKRKCILKHSGTKTKFYEFLVVMFSISLNMHLLTTLHDKIPRRFALLPYCHIFGLNFCLHPYMPC